jgi:omega-amidase
MKKKGSRIKVAVFQFAAEDGEVFRNFETLQKMLARLKKRVDLILLPEMWPSGFRVKGGDLLLRQTRGVLEDLKKWAREKGVYVVGSHLEEDQRGYTNNASVIDPKGRIVGNYQKVHLFQMAGENRKFVPGKKIGVVNTSLARFGLSICYDIRFPELLRKEVLSGAEVLLIPSAWPKVRIDHYKSLLKARAIENLCYVVSANKIGKNASGMIYGGHSIAFDPWGRRLGELGEKQGILTVTLDLDLLKKIRRSFPVFKARREEVYK